ncbi:MAG: HAMP domain-containing histidine kinase [Deltaproteobacteria bacterium]|nr:HAMP domain-containing histidine kinase [Deltaproteobacteria bacterium]
MMTPSRIRARLGMWNLAVFGLVLLVTITAAALSIARVSDLAIDRELQLGAARAATRMAHAWAESDRHERDDERRDEGHDRAPEEDDHDRLVHFAEASPDQFVIAARGGAPAVRIDGRAMPPGLPDARALASAQADGAAVRSSGTVAGARVRMLTVPVRIGGRVAGAVQIVRSLTAPERAVWRSVLVLVITGVAGLVLAAAASAFLAGRAMRPIAAALARQQRFLADASHELRTPVTVLRARADAMLREGEGLQPSVKDELRRLSADADELSLLLGDLLDLARLEAGVESLSIEPVAVGDAAEEMVADLAPMALERGVALVAKAEPAFARAHLGRVRQVLRALIDNALKHTPPGGHVTVSVSRESQHAVLRVADDGEGIAPEHLPQVFDRFFRADEARTRGAGGGGAGLGLAIAAELVHQMRGTIQVESVRGRGTTFTVRLPR